jgi:selT/selW/selH-like putative selenoprotein
VIEYDPADVDAFIAAADALEAAFPGVLVEGNEEQDGRPGSFEVLTSDGELVFSRLAARRAPDMRALIASIASRQAPSGPADEHQSGPSCG